MDQPGIQAAIAENVGDGDISMRRLRVFLVVADLMSVSKAARQLRVSQPAVTQQLRALEDSLGTRLFTRGGRALALTEAGRKALQVSRELLTHVDGSLAQLRQAARGEGLTLRMGFTAPHTALPAARAFRARHPESVLRLTAANTVALFEKLDNLELDVILVGFDAPVERYHCRQIYKQELRVIMPAGHPLSGRGDMALRDLCREPLVVREEGSYTRQLLFDAAARQGLEPIIAYEIASREAVNEAVAQGFGIGTVLSLERPQDPRLLSASLEKGTITGYEYVVCHRDLANVPPLSLFLETLDSPDISTLAE